MAYGTASVCKNQLFMDSTVLIAHVKKWESYQWWSSNKDEVYCFNTAYH